MSRYTLENGTVPQSAKVFRVCDIWDCAVWWVFTLVMGRSVELLVIASVFVLCSCAVLYTGMIVGVVLLKGAGDGRWLYSVYSAVSEPYLFLCSSLP